MHSYSRVLQRIICDFGADHAFGKVNQKLQEHYGIMVPTSSACRITEYHGHQIGARKEWRCASVPKAEIVIGESDGSMLPLVETYLPEGVGVSHDRRKNKRLFWKEARLSLAHAKNSVTPYVAATMESVKEAGEQLMSCVQRAGADEKTQVHCVGDGAPWIAHQVEEQFGARGTYLIDFYHLCEYMAKAAESCAPNDKATWLEKQKERMKQSQHQKVLLALRPYLELAETEEAQAPVRACYRYISNRPLQLDYKRAQEQELPIGSGEIESAHRYVLQERLKIAGAWWDSQNAKDMIALRVCRVNQHWDEYWKQAA